MTTTESTVIQADGTSAQNGDIALYGQSLHCSQAKISGGAFQNMLSAYEGSPVVITKFDASEILSGKSLKKATLTFDSKCTVSGKNSNVQIAHIGTGWDATTATWNNTNTGEILNAVNLNGDGVNVKTSTVTLTQDVTEILGADEDKVIGFAIYTFTGRDQAISNFKLTIEAIDASASSTYTVKYIDANGNELKASDIRSESIGSAATITDADKAAIYNEGHTTKYIYVSDDADGQTVKGDGSTVITVTFREADIWNYTINAVDGDGNLLKALKSGTNFEAETFDVAYGAYINVDGTIYKSGKLSSDKKGYYFSMTLNKNNLTKNVTFTASDITGVVYFSEAEDIEGLTPTNNSNTFIRSSNGASAYAANDDVVFTQLPNGKYKIATVICDASKNAGSVWNFKAGEQMVFEFTASAVNWAEGTSEEFELNQASTDIALVKNGGNNQGVDLIYIIKTGDAELAALVPAYGVMDFISMNLPTSNSGHDGDITEDKTFTADDFTVTISPSTTSTPNRFWTVNGGSQLRVYGGTLTVKAAAGKTLTKIAFSAGSTWGTMTANVGTLDGKTWTGDATEVVFTITKQCQFNSITVGEAPAEPLADAANIAAFKALEVGTKAKLVVDGAKVTFVSGDNAYLEDETGALLLYKTDLTLTAGKALTGYINGAYTEYKGLPELTAIDETAASEFTEADAEINATVVTVAEANTAENVSKLVKLENVNINADLQTITQGEDEIAFYDKFAVMGDFVYPEVAKSIVGIINTTSGYNTFHPVSPDYVVADTPNPPVGDDETFDLTADMFYTWDGYGADASKLSPATVDFNIGNDAELSGGGMVCGTSSVDYLTYADITGCSKMLFEGTPGMPLRVLMNRQESNNGPLVEKNPVIGEDGTAELDLTDLEYVHINAIKVNWGGSGKIASIKLVKPSDALAIPKEALKNIIETAKLYNAVAKTEESYAALQTAIANGEAALKAEDATEESLTAAKNAIEEAIAGLTLMEGYSDLTKEMFMEYASVEEPGEGKAAYGAYSLFEASDLPYGDGNVNYLSWADLTAYDKLIITTIGETKPRLCLNRLIPDGQQAATKEDSKMLDINPNNDFTWSTEAYQTIDGNVYTIDLKKIVDDYNFARLHCIKKQGWGANVFVTGMYLYSGGSSVVTTPCKEITEDYVFTMTEENVAKAVEETWAKGGTTRVDNKKGSVDPATGETLESAKAFPGIGLKKGNAGKAFSTCIKGAVKVIAYGATTSGTEARYVEVTATPTEGEAVTAKAISEPNISAVVELALDATKEYTIEYTGVNEEGAGADVVLHGVKFAVAGAVEPILEVANIAALKANTATLDVKLAANNLQVTVLETGEQGSTMYVEDETGGIQMNDANGIFTEFGQTFNGTLVLKLVYDNEQNTLSLETTEQTATESEFTSEVKDVVAKEVTLADATSANYDLKLIKVMNVGMASKNIYYGEGEEDFNTAIVLTDGEKELLINDMFGKLTAETLYDNCNATGIIMTAPEYNDNNEVVGTVDLFVPTGVGIEEVVIVIPETGRQWDFTAMSEADEALLAADTEHWSVSKNRYQNNGIAFNDEVIKVNGVELDVTKGLLFTAEASKLLLGSGVSGSNHYMQVQKGSSFKVTGLAVGDTVRMVVQTSSKNAATAAAPASSVANIIEGFEAVTEIHTCTFVMCEAGDIVLKGDNCDLRFLTLEVKEGNPNEVANLREWNFSVWSEETKNNLAADAATIVPGEDGTYPTVTPWRSYEKVGGPTETDPDREGAAYWYGTAISGAEELTANGTVIAETKGLLFNTMGAGALAIAIDYPSTSLGTYEGPAYLWIGGKNNSFTIPNVKSGSKIKLGIESHKNTDARGVKLTIDGNEIGSAVPTTYETFTISVPGELTDGTLSDVVVTNTNGCHIYYISVDATGTIEDAINEVKTEVKVINDGVYTINGIKVRNAGESLNGLAKGMYIVGGKKIIIK